MKLVLYTPPPDTDAELLEDLQHPLVKRDLTPHGVRPLNLWMYEALAAGPAMGLFDRHRRARIMGHGC